jgi:hypothetical protein
LSRGAFLSGILSRRITKFPLDIPVEQTSFPLAPNKRDHPTPFGHKSAIAGHGEWTAAKARVLTPKIKRPELESNHSFLSNAKVKEKREEMLIYSSSRLCLSYVGKDRFNITFHVLVSEYRITFKPVL